MKAIIRTKSGPELQEVAKPSIRESTDVLVRVKAASICRTDLYAAYGQIAVDDGRILGHEFSGVVEGCGAAVEGFAEGDRVVGNPFLPCGLCSDCVSRAPHRCANSTFIGLDRDGAFAEYILVPQAALSRLPSEIPFPVGTYVEPVAAGLAIFESTLKTTDSILVVGEGRICRLTVAILKNAGFNAVRSVSVSNIETVSGEFDVVIETAPLEDVIEVVVSVLKTRGLLILKSRNPTRLPMPVLELIRKQIRIEAVKYAPFDEAMSYVCRHHVDLSTSLSSVWTLADFEEAFAVSMQSEEHKICFNLER